MTRNRESLRRLCNSHVLYLAGQIETAIVGQGWDYSFLGSLPFPMRYDPLDSGQAIELDPEQVASRLEWAFNRAVSVAEKPDSFMNVMALTVDAIWPSLDAFYHLGLMTQEQITRMLERCRTKQEEQVCLTNFDPFSLEGI